MTARAYFTLLFVAVLAALVLYFVYVRGTSSASVTNYPPKNEIIVAFGDSLVSGYGASGRGFVEQLSERLGRDIVNLGVPGDTTKDGLERLPELFSHDPGIVLLLLGGNDFLRRTDETTIRENLSRIIEALQERGAVVVLLGVRSGILSDGGARFFEELSETYGTVYVPDVLRGVFRNPDLMYDGIHPNEAGYAIIADRLFEVFQEQKL